MRQINMAPNQAPFSLHLPMDNQLREETLVCRNVFQIARFSDFDCVRAKTANGKMFTVM